MAEKTMRQRLIDDLVLRDYVEPVGDGHIVTPLGIGYLINHFRYSDLGRKEFADAAATGDVAAGYFNGLVKVIEYYSSDIMKTLTERGFIEMVGDIPRVTNAGRKHLEEFSESLGVPLGEIISGGEIDSSWHFEALVRIVMIESQDENDAAIAALAERGFVISDGLKWVVTQEGSNFLFDWFDTSTLGRNEYETGVRSGDTIGGKVNALIEIFKLALNEDGSFSNVDLVFRKRYQTPEGVQDVVFDAYRLPPPPDLPREFDHTKPLILMNTHRHVSRDFCQELENPGEWEHARRVCFAAGLYVNIVDLFMDDAGLVRILISSVTPFTKEGLDRLVEVSLESLKQRGRLKFTPKSGNGKHRPPNGYPPIVSNKAGSGKRRKH